MRWNNRLGDQLKSRRTLAKEQKAELDSLRKENPLEKADYLALVLGALWALMPFVLFMLAGYYIISMFFFG